MCGFTDVVSVMHRADGSGGNGHALAHFQSTRHPLVCKMGTITPEGRIQSASLLLMLGSRRAHTSLLCHRQALRIATATRAMIRC